MAMQWVSHGDFLDWVLWLIMVIWYIDKRVFCLSLYFRWERTNRKSSRANGTSATSYVGVVWKWGIYTPNGNFTRKIGKVMMNRWLEWESYETSIANGNMTWSLKLQGNQVWNKPWISWCFCVWFSGKSSPKWWSSKGRTAEIIQAIGHFFFELNMVKWGHGQLQEAHKNDDRQFIIIFPLAACPLYIYNL